MSAEQGTPDQAPHIDAPIAPTPPPSAPVNYSAISAPTPPPPDPQLNPNAQERKKPVRTIAGVIIALLVIGGKIFIAAGASHWLTGGSAPVVIVVVVALIILGFLGRFLRM